MFAWKTVVYGPKEKDIFHPELCSYTSAPALPSDSDSPSYKMGPPLHRLGQIHCNSFLVGRDISNNLFYTTIGDMGALS